MQNIISAVILAGGEAKRFGGIAKTEVLIGGKKIIERMLNVLDNLFEEIIIVTNNPGPYAGYKDCLIARDIFLKKGPLGGIHAAMRESVKEAFFVFAGDMPFLDEKLIIRQVEEFKSGDSQALVPVVNGLEEPLHAIYRKSIADDIEKILKKNAGSSVKDLLGNIKTEYLELTSTPEIIKAFTNINSLKDLGEAENIYL